MNQTENRKIMEPRTTIWIFTLVLTCIAAAWDWRSRKIPNWLTVPGVVAGITLHAALAGWHGTVFAVEGTIVALALLLPLVWLRALGAGDWKLMGAVGAFLGWQLFLFVLVGSIFASGIMASVQMCRVGRVMETLRNMWTLVKGFFAFGLKKNPIISLDNPRLLKLPFGVAVAAATIACCCAAYWPALKHIL
jgi:prepilin peptidase CpaA